MSILQASRILASAGTGQNRETLFTTLAAGARGQRHHRQGHKSS